MLAVTKSEILSLAASLPTPKLTREPTISMVDEDSL